MKPSTALLLPCIILLFIFISCAKKATNQVLQTPPVSLDSIARCHQTSLWDSASISNHLNGKWEWEFIKCFWNSEDANSTDFKGLTAEFKPNHIVDISLNGVQTQSSAWEIVRLNDGYYKLNTTPLVLQLPGKILCCANRIIFNDSYVDGCDNYFKKSD